MCPCCCFGRRNYEMHAFICIPLFCGLAQLRPFSSCNQLQTCSGLVYNYQDRIVSVYMNVIEHWIKAKVARFSLARLEFSLFYLPHTFDSFYTLPHQKYQLPSFSKEGPLKVIQLGIKIFSFNGNHTTKLKRGNRERTSVHTDIWSRTMADIWSEKNVGFIGPIKFLSDLTVGLTHFVKSASSRNLNVAVVHINTPKREFTEATWTDDLNFFNWY